ncbi:hypothetical protein Q0F99_18115 [Rathayibacter oskolensis]|uniref:hypothetical protein n=1 Tax=Rathayibacter oskolensis TaxID=1891671 RepID=UPI00265EA087|nr:hypothetical protein [Rathayibacter oskolensis]WKK71332.1 hypothetical protein Q0F99_18115 [Rathayibacter oskolensis]
MPRTIDRDARKEQLAEAVWRVVREARHRRRVGPHRRRGGGRRRRLAPARVPLSAPSCWPSSAELMVLRSTERIIATPWTGDALADAVAFLRHLLPLEPDSRAELEVNIALIAETPALTVLREIRDEARPTARRAVPRRRPGASPAGRPTPRWSMRRSACTRSSTASPCTCSSRDGEGGVGGRRPGRGAVAPGADDAGGARSPAR